jgi:hypothetical protein
MKKDRSVTELPVYRAGDREIGRCPFFLPPNELVNIQLGKTRIDGLTR